MTTTTAAAIRDVMLTLVEAITPTVHAGTPFRAHRELQPFREWAEANPKTCLRRFSIRYTGKFAPATVSDIDVEETADTFELVVAFPTDARFGANVLTSIDDIVESDETQLHAAIGPPGYQSLSAPACVLNLDGWEREDGERVTFATIRYRVLFYRATGAVPSDVTVTGLNGLALAEGTILTLTDDGEDALRALVIQNGLFKLTYELPDALLSEPAACHPFLKYDGEWLRLAHPNYGDWSFFVVPTPVYDEIEILESSGDAVEIAFRILAHQINTAYLSNYGVTDRDADGDADYENNASLKAITVLRVTKLVRMERGKAGYYHAWHSEPRCAPSLKSLMGGPGAVENNESDFGEREFGPGHGAGVVWSSNPLAGVARFPAWIDKAEWDTAEAAIGHAIANHAWWAGIDDATYQDMAHPAYAQTQNNSSGFPREQLTGPWYVADIPTFTGHEDVCRFTVQQMPLESGAWGFSDTGDTTNHFCHSWPAGDGRMLKFQVFYGAVHHVADSSNSYANEPTQAIQNEVARIAAALEWPK